MIQNCKICGVKDTQTLKYIINHKYPPKMIGFICNWPNSKRYVSNDQLKELLKVNKKETSYVAVLVNPTNDMLEKIIRSLITKSISPVFFKISLTKTSIPLILSNILPFEEIKIETNRKTAKT